MITGIPIVFGIKPTRPIVNAPSGVKIRVRLRENKVGKAFLKYPDRVEQWAIGYEGDTMAGDWALKFQQAANL